MNKDTLVASIIGFGLGLVAAILLWVLPYLMPKINPQNKKATATANATVNPSATDVTGNLELNSPQDGEITKNKNLDVKGKVTNSSVLTVSTAVNSVVVKPQADGSFNAPLNLNEGANQIVVTSITLDKTESKSLTVYFFDQNL